MAEVEIGHDGCVTSVVRLALVSHGLTAAMRQVRFPDDEPLDAAARRAVQVPAADRVLVAPELRARQTAGLIAGTVSEEAGVIAGTASEGTRLVAAGTVSEGTGVVAGTVSEGTGLVAGAVSEGTGLVAGAVSGEAGLVAGAVSEAPRNSWDVAGGWDAVDAAGSRVGTGGRMPGHPSVQADDRLRDLDVGAWRGTAMAEVDVTAWLTDPAFDGHGGESIVSLLDRVSGWLDQVAAQGGSTVAVTHPAVVRAAVLRAVSAPPHAFWRIDVAPLSVTHLHWRGAWTLRLT